MKILITGGAGFIGSHLTDYLLKNTNHNIICIDNLYSGRKVNIDPFIYNFPKRYNFIN